MSQSTQCLGSVVPLEMFSLYKIRERKIQSVLWIHFPLLSVSLWYRWWAFETQPPIAINCTACYCSYCIVLLYINKIVGTFLTIIAQWWTFYESQLLRLLRSNSTLVWLLYSLSYHIIQHIVISLYYTYIRDNVPIVINCTAGHRLYWLS